MDIKFNSLEESIESVLQQAQGKDVPIHLIVDTLAGRGQAALLIFLVLPFCQPIQIPGFSTLFGIVLMFIGLRITFGERLRLPKKLVEKTITYSAFEKVGLLAIRMTKKLRFFTRARLVYLVNTPIFHFVHGLSITLLAFLLFLPLPIPLTNLLTAYPLLVFGLALLEDDGIMIIIAYILFFLSLAAFASLALFGNKLFTSMMAL